MKIVVWFDTKRERAGRIQAWHLHHPGRSMGLLVAKKERAKDANGQDHKKKKKLTH